MLKTALASLLFAAPTVAQIPIGGTYTLAVTSARADAACPGPVPTLLATQFATLTLSPTGAFTLEIESSESCAAGSFAQQLESDAGTYVLDFDGSLVLDFDPSQPGVDVASFFMSWDRNVLVGQLDADGEPDRAIGVRRGGAMITADLAGTYASNHLRQRFVAGGPELRTGIGAYHFDGAGGWTSSFDVRTLAPGGATGAGTTADGGTYQVASNGLLSLPGSATPRGQLAPDGSVGFVVSDASQAGAIDVFTRVKGAPPTPGALGGDWIAALYGGVHDGSGAVAILDTSGVASVDAVAGTFAFTGYEATVGTGNSGPTATFGSVQLAADGSFQLVEHGVPFPDRCQLAAGESLAVAAAIDEPGYASSFVLVRARGPLDADVDQVSLASGGVQQLAIGAGDAQAGKLYVIVGSASGTYPGTHWAGQPIPLNADAYHLYTLGNLGAGPFPGTVGFLAPDGSASAQIVVPAGLSQSLSGTTLASALLVFGPSGLLELDVVSQPVPLALAP